MKDKMINSEIDWEEVFRAISDPAMILDREQRMLALNPAVERVTGMGREELLGRYCYEIFHGMDHPPEGCPHQALLESFHPETMDVEMEVLSGIYLVTVAPILDENGRVSRVVHVARDITERKQTEERIKKLNTALKTICEFNQRLVRAEDETSLLHELCEILLQAGGYRMAWVGYVAREKGKDVRPVAHAGFEDGYLDFLRIRADNAERGRGPTGTAIRTGKPSVFQDIRNDPAFAPWRDMALERGYVSAIGLPLMSGDECIGALTIYADEPYRFDEEEVKLLLELADDLAYGVAVIRARKAHRAAEKALMTSEEKYRRLVEMANDAIFVADAETGVIIDANRRAGELLGLPAEKIIGMHQTELHPSEERDRYQAIFKKYAVSGKVIADDIWVVNSKGRHIPVQVSASAFTLGKRKIIQGIFRDMTERRRMEEQLIQAQKLEAIGTLAGGIAHDFNNILVPIMGYAELAASQIPRESRLHSYLSEVIEAARRARDLVRQILTFSHKDEEKKESVTLQPMIKETVKFLQSVLPSNIEVRLNIDLSAGHVFCTPAHIHQLIMNLCTNAYQAMADRGGEIGVELEGLELKEGDMPRSGLTPGRYVCLSVKDTGVGMDRETMGRIFEPYFTTKGLGQGGTGLGLAVVYGIVRMYKGYIDVRSEPGRGSTFRVYLPESVPGQHSFSKGPAEEEIPTGSDERILLVDDEQQVLQVLQGILEQLGYRVTSFNESSQALDAFRDSPDKYDLVITDQTMPVMLGDELAKKILDIRPGIPIILCSGYGSLSVKRRKAGAGGIRAVLTKPVNRTDLARCVRQVFEEARQNPGQSRTGRMK